MSFRIADSHSRHSDNILMSSNCLSPRPVEWDLLWREVLWISRMAEHFIANMIIMLGRWDYAFYRVFDARHNVINHEDYVFVRIWEVVFAVILILGCWSCLAQLMGQKLICNFPTKTHILPVVNFKYYTIFNFKRRQK